MKKFLLLFAFIFSIGISTTSAKEVEITNETVEAPCSTRYEVFVNGSFAGYHTEYNYSLSCSGQASGVILLTVAPILA